MDGSSEIRLLGPVAVVRSRAELHVGGPRERALLAYLALRRHLAVAIDDAVDALWFDPPETARKIVRMYATRLRAVLGDAVEIDRGTFRVAADSDVRRFEDLTAKARSEEDSSAARRLLMEALALCRGVPLSDVSDAPFVRPERLRLEELVAAAQAQLIDVELATGRHGEVLPELEALATRRPLDEHVRAQLMLALYRSGRQADALAAYRDARRVLHETLGIEPGPELRRLERAILHHAPELEPARARTPGRRAALPSPLTPLVGRDADAASAAALVTTHGARVVTFTGVGGIGKTRLALEVARLLRERFADGAVFVDLTGLSDAELVAPTLVDALGAPSRSAGDAESALAAHLRERRALLVLDNFEHLLPAAPVLARVVAAASGVVMLVTSRARLRISCEREFHVEPLAAADAAQLFVARAGVELGAGDTAVGEICARLDGIPLAIELAAARARVLPPPALLERLTHRLDLLTHGAPDAPPRQQTLRATLDWSFRLLDERERKLFARLAVFAGTGAELEAIEAVCGDAADLDVLTSLLDKSLVRRTAHASARFGMLETVREYAEEQLESSGAAEEYRRRHAEWYARFAVDAAPHLRRDEQASWLDRLDAEHDNLRVAFRSRVRLREGEAALALVNALARFWYARGYYAEGIASFTEALALGAGAPASLRATALRSLGVLATRVGRAREAITWLEEGVALAHEDGDLLAEARALLPLGHSRAASGDVSGAVAAAEASERLFRRIGDERARAIAVNNIGAYALQLGDPRRALRAFDEAIPISSTSGDKQTRALAVCNRAFALLETGAYAEAEAALTEALGLCRELGFREVTAYALEALAALALAEGRDADAARLADAADDLEDALQLQLEPYEERLRTRVRAEVRKLGYRRSVDRARPVDPFVRALVVAGSGNKHF